MKQKSTCQRTSRFARLTELMSPSRQPIREGTASPATRPAQRSAKKSASAEARVIHLDPVAAVRAEERKRVGDVFASEHVRGREITAALLLVRTNMSAPAITSLLSKLAASPDADAAAKVDLALSPVGQPDGYSNYGWSDVHAEIRRRH